MKMRTRDPREHLHAAWWWRINHMAGNFFFFFRVIHGMKQPFFKYLTEKNWKVNMLKYLPAVLHDGTSIEA